MYEMLKNCKFTNKQIKKTETETETWHDDVMHMMNMQQILLQIHANSKTYDKYKFQMWLKHIFTTQAHS